MSKNCEDWNCSNTVFHIIYTNLMQLENSTILNDSTEGYVQFQNKFYCYENSRLTWWYTCSLYGDYHMYVTSRLLTDKTVSSLRVGVRSPSPFCQQNITITWQSLMNLYLMNDMVDCVLTDKPFLSPLVQSTILKEEFDVKEQPQ